MKTASFTYDVIVIGLGAVGAATTYHLALSGKRVLGIDQYSPPHIFGSSHGDTRITRLAIGEGEGYAPFGTIRICLKSRHKQLMNHASSSSVKSVTSIGVELLPTAKIESG